MPEPSAAVTVSSFLTDFSIPAEFYGVFGFLAIVIWIRIEVSRSEKLKETWEKFINNILSRKYVAWAVVTVFFWFDHFVWGNFGEDSLSFESYLIFTCITFGISSIDKVYGKKIGEVLKP